MHWVAFFPTAVADTAPCPRAVVDPLPLAAEGRSQEVVGIVTDIPGAGHPLRMDSFCVGIRHRVRNADPP